jgi:glycine/D-amino acid oxidase-like deaminating enzyme
MLGDRLSHGLWELSAPPAPETTALVGRQKTDVAIIGAGYTGLSAALHLAGQGVSALVVEAAEIGYGGSGRNVGLVNAGLWLTPGEVIEALGETHGERVLDLLGNAPAEVFKLVDAHGLDCEAVPMGTLHCAVGNSGLKSLEERERQWQARGAPVKLIDKAEATRRIGTTAYAGALFDGRAGTIQPLAYARGLARVALGAGARIFTGSPVTSVTRDGPVWRLKTREGEVEATRVIVATNAYTVSPFAEMRGELIHLPYFNFATAPLSARQLDTVLPGKEGTWDTREVLTSFRLDKAGRLVFGSVGALSGLGHAIHRDWARRAMTKIFPALAGVPFEAAWYGTIGMTVDAVPRLHRPAENIFAICGYNGRGIAPGTVFGRALADWALGARYDADMPLPVGPVRAAPWRATRETFYRHGAELAHFADARI